MFEIFSTKEKSEHLVASTVRWDERQGQWVAQAQEERSQRSEQDEHDKGDLCWTEACEGIERRLLKLFGGQRSRESQHKRTDGTSLVSKRIEDQHRAHCEASKK